MYIYFFSALLLFLSICIFGGKCWDRDWLLYPNYNYVSWSYAFAVFSCMGHIVATIFLYIGKKEFALNRYDLFALKPRLNILLFSLYRLDYKSGTIFRCTFCVSFVSCTVCDLEEHHKKNHIGIRYPAKKIEEAILESLPSLNSINSIPCKGGILGGNTNKQHNFS